MQSVQKWGEVSSEGQKKSCHFVKSQRKPCGWKLVIVKCDKHEACCYQLLRLCYSKNAYINGIIKRKKNFSTLGGLHNAGAENNRKQLIINDA